MFEKGSIWRSKWHNGNIPTKRLKVTGTGPGCSFRVSGRGTEGARVEYGPEEDCVFVSELDFPYGKYGLTVEHFEAQYEKE